MNKEFIKKSTKIHGKLYDYSMINYINSHIKVEIICNGHGIFLIRPNNHLSGQGCRKCGILKRQKFQSKTTDKFIEDAKLIHKNKYDYSKVNYTTNHDKIEIKCNECQLSFYQKPNSHLSGQGCPLCNKNHDKSIFDYKKNTKICKKCGIEKSVNDFYKGNGSKRNIKYVYYRGMCKECEKNIKVEYRKLLENKIRRRLYDRIYSKQRKLTDPVYKLRKDISTIIKRSVKKNYSGDSIWNYLPYKPIDLRLHLENQFDENMSWENHGKYWHIDHIKPCILLPFDNTLHPNFLECWSLNNLRPLKAIDNLRKSSIFNGINHRRNSFIKNT